MIYDIIAFVVINMNFVMDPKSKYVGNLLVILLELLIGILLLVLPAEAIIQFFLLSSGIVLVIWNILPCLYGWRVALEQKKYLLDAITSTISVVLGILMIVLPNLAVNILLACWFIVMPLLRIFLDHDPKTRLKKELPYFLVAIFLFILSFSLISKIIVRVLGILFLILAVLHFILCTRIYRIAKKLTVQTSSYTSEKEKDAIDAEVKDL